MLKHNRHESRVKHVVVESKRDPVARVMYHITPNGPYFDSLYALIQEACTTAIIQNHAFDLVLGSSPIKVRLPGNLTRKFTLLFFIV